jgi:hypothetical protein
MAKTHVRRTPEQIVADLQAKIAAVEARAAAKEARSKPETTAFLLASRAVVKALRDAQAQRNAEMERALEAALATMSAHAVESGIRMPQPREPKPSAKRKKTAAA